MCAKIIPNPRSVVVFGFIFYNWLAAAAVVAGQVYFPEDESNYTTYFNVGVLMASNLGGNQCCPLCDLIIVL